MSTRLSLFDSPLFLGFDQFEKTIDQMRKSGTEGYPPYNIEQISETDLRITLAVAGFSMDELDIQLENNKLTVRGKHEEDEDRIYIHRGIASRQFLRSFVLADGVEVNGAYLDNGLLHIDLSQIVPESKVRKIEINGSGAKAREAIDVSSGALEDQSEATANGAAKKSTKSKG